MTLWLRYLIAFIVACHGVTYIPFGIVIPIAEKRWRGTSWLLGSALTQRKLRALTMVLHLIAGILIFACASHIICLGMVVSAGHCWDRNRHIGICGVLGWKDTTVCQ
jgi:hypothetical protein